MPKVIVTGGCGYIGSHTLVELAQAGYDPVSIDDNSRSSEDILGGVRKIVGRQIRNCRVDLKNVSLTGNVLAENRDALAVIHFAAYKTVPESVARPLLYYDNNLNSLINVLNFCDQYAIPSVIFSSSCAVYGNSQELPVTEDTPFGAAECPYARSKQMGEQIIRDFSKVSRTRVVSLRYFNPVGAHPSIEIGEVPCGEPDNLVPRITQTAIGVRPEFVVCGGDYSTPDGTPIRDYIHVSDIARAHVDAIRYLVGELGAGSPEPDPPRSQARAKQGDGPEAPFRGTAAAPFAPEPCVTFNLGTGTGLSVLEMIKAFETVSDVKLNYRIGPRRPGDVKAVYADSARARVHLGWQPRYSIEDMMRTAWQWEQRLRRNQSSVPGPDSSS